MSILPVDPLETIEQIVVLVFIAVLMAFLYKYRENVMLALTGDTHIHGGSLDLFWYLLRCGGLCTGEWTRCLTNLPCLPPKYRGTNIIKAIGRYMGLATKTVEIKNLVVGDIPFRGRGDFFLTVQCNNNPDMVTSLAEERLPKVVHFPEVLTLRMRHSPLEANVRIVVKELNVLGAQELCECHISAMNVCDWASDDLDNLKRFEMKPLNASFEAETPAWILVEFGEPTDSRDLESLSHTSTVVRTATRAGETEDRDIANFKSKYSLVSTSGHPINEPLEADLQQISNFRSSVVCGFHSCNILVVMLITGYALFRFYIWSCYRQFHALTIASLTNETFPISSWELARTVKACAEEYDGTGIAAGAVACRPTNEQTLQVCQHVPPHQPRPTAFAHIVNEYFDTQIEGAPCFMGLCEFRQQLVEWDSIIALSCVILLASTFLLRHFLNAWIRRKRANLQSRRGKELKTFNRKKMQQAGLLSIEEDVSP